MPGASSIPKRSDIPVSDTWDLSSLFASEEAWEKGLAELEARLPSVAALKGRLGESKEAFLKALGLYSSFGLLDERLGVYASLRQSEDQGDDGSRGRFGRYMAAATRAQAEWAWFEPGIQALDPSFVESCLADPAFADYAVFLKKLLRWKPHILSEREERLLALQAESAGVASDAFNVLTDVDLDFGTIDTPEGKRPLSQSSYSSFLRNPDREIRRKAYFQFYEGFDKHKNTLAALYSGSVKRDKYRAVARNFGSSIEAALFPDDVPTSVYGNLVGTISANLPALHEYYELRRRALKLDELRHYDVYVPLAPEARARHSYAEAVGIVAEALAPLGEEYVSTLRSGLEGRWVDRYENKGKDSGAFSSGSFSADPYILLNYKEDVLHDLFTIAHEGGHSMHSYYSSRSNPFLSYSYAIFEAEVASTFNEQLVFRYLYEHAASDAERASLASAKVDDLVATLFRQTMFAEFERRSHEMAESDETLTVDALRGEYRKLLEKYFGKAMKLEEVSDLECLRIPHFYRAFYVYKYATGISASVALSERVLGGAARGSSREREDYFAFLRSGGSRFPIESLKVAGVDMSASAPVAAACANFSHWTGELKRLLKL
jgi:oligoendopeptidase F